MNSKPPPRFTNLLKEIRACTLCEASLPLGPRPVVQVHPQARILVAGQAPGAAVHESGIPFDDPSGDRLREWMGIDRQTFYDARRIALVPMGFCYPGRGTGGDRPPRPECATTWRESLLAQLNNIRFTLVLGRHAINWHHPELRAATLTDIVGDWQVRWPGSVVLPHPSPRNANWLRRHPRVETDLVPRVQARVREVLSQD